MYGFNSDLFLSILRQVLTVLGTFVAAKGWIGADSVNEVVGAVVILASAGFSAFFHASSNGVIQTLSTTSNAAPNVETRTVVTPATTNSPASTQTTVTATKPAAV